MLTPTRYAHPDAIVSTDWLAGHLSDPNLRIFDCTTYLRYEAGTGRPYRVESGREDYGKGHIPGAAFLDLQDELSDGKSRYSFMMLPLEELAARFAERGIGNGLRVVLYARKTPQWATRIWWMLRAVGWDDVAILDGGIDKWEAEGRPTETGERRYPSASFTARPRPGLFVGKDEVAGAIGDAQTCTINALSSELHKGDNPRYGRPGRVPGSVNVPAAALLDSDSLAFKTPEEATQLFQAVGADRSKSMLLYCGGGIAATLDAFLLYQLGYTDIAVYDASMSEWAKDESLPIERG